MNTFSPKKHNKATHAARGSGVMDLCMSINEVVTQDTGMVYVGFWRRAVAKMIDLLIICAAYLLFKGYLPNSFIAVSIIYIFYMLLCRFYFIYGATKYGCTFGKKLLGIRICNIDGGNISYIQSVVRDLPDILQTPVMIFAQLSVIQHLNLQSWISAGFIETGHMMKGLYPQWYNWFMIIYFPIYYFDCLIVPFNKQRRSIHDFLARSYVVKSNP